jgi:hypothetical protein
MWQQTTMAGEKNWEQALSYCESLSLAGFTDWRLPTVKELISLVDYSRSGPAINILLFQDTLSAFYWSSTTYTFSEIFAWGVNFDEGCIDIRPKSYSDYAYNVRAVRGGLPQIPTCTATINNILSLHIPYLYYGTGIITLSAEFVFEYNPSSPTLIPFKLIKAAVISNPSFSCSASTISDDFKIHIPDVLLPDGVTHLWLDLEYSPLLSTDGKFYWVVSNYGVNSN